MLRSSVRGLRLKTIARSVAVGLGLYGVACAALALCYRDFLYPVPHRGAYAVPEGSVIREHLAPDGTPVHAMHLLNTTARDTVVYFHGNGEIVDDDVGMGQALVAQGFAVTLVEYRGYGRSSGHEPTEEGLYLDATTVLDDLAAHGIGPDRIVLWGMSLGSGVAVEMAKRGRGRALVLVAPYTSVLEMAQRYVPFLPVRWIMDDHFDNLAAAPSLHLPTVVVHGRLDEVIPFAMGERLARALPGARFEPIAAAHHMDCFRVEPDLLGRVTTAIRR
jgi:pimeloyl-ACP methyl ester carboxylesterase